MRKEKKLDQLSLFGLSIETKQKKASSKKTITQLNVPIKNKRQNENIDPLDTLFPMLFPEEYNELVCKSYKGKRDSLCRSFVLWNYDTDVKIIQENLFTLAVSELRSLEYLSERVLIEHLEWIIDDPIDDFSFLSCLSVFALPNYISEEDILKLKDDSLNINITKIDAYELVGQFLEEQKELLHCRLEKTKKLLAHLEFKGLQEDRQHIYRNDIEQGDKNLVILRAFLNIYFK